MLTRTWKNWLGVFAGLIALCGGLYALLWAQGFTTGANAVSIIATVAVGAWSLRGLYVWREVTWVRRVNSFVIAGFAFGLVYLILHAAGASVLARSVLYLFATVAGFMLGINIIRLITIYPLLLAGFIFISVTMFWILSHIAIYETDYSAAWIEILLHLLTFVMFAATQLILHVSVRAPVAGIANVMVEEAIRMKVALIFIIAILVLLPTLALALVSDDRLTYTVQRFLTYSLIFVSFLLSVMTVILASYTTSNDLKSKMVYMSLTKPLSRPQFLLGKWIGIVLLNAVLLTVSGVAIAGFTYALADGKAMNAQDKEELRKEVLTARISQVPVPIEGSVEEMVDRILAIRQDRDPERFGQVGAPASALPDRVYQEVFTEALSKWFTVGPRETTTYRFTGLEVARDNALRVAQQAQEQLVGYGLTPKQAEEFVQWRNHRRAQGPEVDLTTLMTEDDFNEILALLDSEKVQFSFNPYTSPEPEDGMVVMTLVVNDLPWPIREVGSGYNKVAVDAPQEIALPAWLIDDEGVLELTIGVPEKRRIGQTTREVEQTAIQFNRKDAVPEIFYRVGSFEGNIARSMMVLWVRLAFLTMFSLLVGSLFSFPVACLAGLMVYIIAAFSGFLSEAVSSFTAVPDADTTWGVVSGAVGGFFAALGDGAIVAALKLLVGLFAKLVMLLIPSFGEFNPGPALADGKIVPTSMLLSALLRIGLLWTGVITIIGFFFFHRRELARVTA